MGKHIDPTDHRSSVNFEVYHLALIAHNDAKPPECRAKAPASHSAMTLEINLIDVALVSILIFLIISLIRPSPRSRSVPALDGYQSQPSKHPQCLLHKNYTPSELAVYDGKQPEGQGRLLLAIQRRMKAKNEKAERGWTEVRLERTVFDVSSGRGFYGPGEGISDSRHCRSCTITQS